MKVDELYIFVTTTEGTLKSAIPFGLVLKTHNKNVDDQWTAPSVKNILSGMDEKIFRIFASCIKSFTPSTTNYVTWTVNIVVINTISSRGQHTNINKDNYKMRK